MDKQREAFHEWLKDFETTNGYQADMWGAWQASQQFQQELYRTKQSKLSVNDWPEQCPITRRDFFMEIDGVPTYGGPYDSYTIPEMTGEPDQPWHERELFVRRYDHDWGGWVDDEFIPLRIIHEDVLMELEDNAEAQ